MITQFFPITIKEVVKETKDAVSLVFVIPDELKDTFSYKQGQYLTLKFELEGKEFRRAYSFSSSPLTDEHPKVSIKRVEGGLVSNYINDELKAGDQVMVMPANGRFFTELEEGNRKTYYLFGGGSGITPLMSILKTVLEKEAKSSVNLLYANRDKESIIFKKELDALKERYAGQFEVVYALDNPPVSKEGGFLGVFKKTVIEWDGPKGPVNQEIISDFLKNHPVVGQEAEYFICGPTGMMQVAKKSLENLGIPKSKVHIEVFSSIQLPHEDKPDPEQAGTTGDGSKKQVLVHLGGKQHQIEVGDKESILDALLKQKIDAPFSCTAGACATCMGKLIKGQVKMDACFALDEDEIEQGFILTCQAHPITPEVEVSYDLD